MFTKAIFATLAALSVVSAAPSFEKRDDSQGTATYYTASGVGACGSTISDSDYIVAMNAAQYDSSVCNKQIWTWNAATQRLAFATVVDLCPSCSSGDLDLSTSLFSYLSDGNLDQGVFDVKWGFA
ncbi:hypothetical protein CNN00760 [Cryptococcus deneoformans JEC21]|uniref:Barwin domain-containing protein n=1 Tax=Cryptococcus deneoformans (strain JEC21 / ATCC MYA-565) TaxID=214684 RepID=Q5K783_CRYD1|nr:hypothetical protein CNN00760 [Cryptococcus neoformans var. neoformans JEC21]AAW47097.1 hypothetical protein CNN00760 [Cryptococcus neoformans var. neoformans JEC21]